MPASAEKIILAAIACIEANGIHAVTVRDVAAEAGVNIAAINYHFGTKDKLLDAVLKLTFQNALDDWHDILGRGYASPRQLFHDLFRYSMEGMMRFPNITRAHLYDPITNDDYSGFFVKKFNAFLVSLADKVEPISKNRSREDIELSIMQMFSALLFTGLAPGLFRGYKHIDLKSVAGRRAFTDRLVTAYW